MMDKRKHTMSVTEPFFNKLIKHTKMQAETIAALKAIMVDGEAYTDQEGYTKQFLYKKVTRLREIAFEQYGKEL